MEMIEIRLRVQFWRCHNKPTQRDTDTGESLGTPSQKELGILKIIKNITFGVFRKSRSRQASFGPYSP